MKFSLQNLQNVAAGSQLSAVNGSLPIEVTSDKIYVVDFFTSCCINCIHALDTLQWLAENERDVVLIGVHSPKYKGERSIEHLIDFLAKHGAHHLVLNDPDKILMQAFGLNVWPTIFISKGSVLQSRIVGEPSRRDLLSVMSSLSAESSSQLRELGGNDFQACTEATGCVIPSKALRFPSRIATTRDGSLFVADAGHHQILECDSAGRTIRRIGSGRQGFHDGAAHESAFNRPSGILSAQDTLYVADAGNHAIRTIDLASGTVVTLCGSNVRGPILREPIELESAYLASPWDLEWLVFRGDPCLAFCNAGTHQLGLLNLRRKTVEVLAGSGSEGMTDGPRLTCELAQPTGLAYSDETGLLAFCDSETSAIRILDPMTGGVRTIVGSGLYHHGYRDGPLRVALLQHPNDVAWAGARLVVADTFNSAIRLLDFDEGVASTISRPLDLREPGGVHCDADTIWIVDTGNHRIAVLRPAPREAETVIA